MQKVIFKFTYEMEAELFNYEAEAFVCEFKREFLKDFIDRGMFGSDRRIRGKSKVSDVEINTESLNMIDLDYWEMTR